MKETNPEALNCSANCLAQTCNCVNVCEACETGLFV